MARTLKELAVEALAVQDACNLSGVALSFGQAMLDLRQHIRGTHESAVHPITRVWINKLIDLAGDAQVSDWNAVDALAKGE